MNDDRPTSDASKQAVEFLRNLKREFPGASKDELRAIFVKRMTGDAKFRRPTLMASVFASAFEQTWDDNQRLN